MTNTPPQFSAANYRLPIVKPRSVQDLPPDVVTTMSAKICMLTALAWDYTETIQQIAKILHVADTRKISREVNELRRRYDQRRSRSLSDSDIRAEKEIALMFEEQIQGHLTKLSYSLRNEIKRDHPDLLPDWQTLVEATHIAATVLDAARLYAAHCDRYIASQGLISAHSILADEIPRLRTLVPEFAGDCWIKDSQAQSITAKILYNAVLAIELFDENGKV